ncbi:MAG: mercury(II) reductase [Firmicutes bacterium]|nr:mercury(II) reductase [Bacillota bacterium]
MTIEGMTCPDCERHVTKALEALGAYDIRVSFHDGQATFWAPDDLAASRAFKAVSDAGYHPRNLTAVESCHTPTTEYRMTIEGMTCVDCEVHVARALESAGATNVVADYRRGEARFRAPKEFSEERARANILEAGYRPQVLQPVSGGTEPTGFTSDDRADYDLVVIGSGSAAFAAAIEARKAGARVAMIERGTIGGTCVNVGCVPSKTLLRAGELYHWSVDNPFQGLNTTAGAPDLAALVSEKDQLVATLRRQKYEDLLSEYGIAFIAGEARFVDQQRVAVGDRYLMASRYILATGTRPRIPSISGLTSVEYLTSTTALNLTRRPDHLLVIGSGYIALELGQLFRHWGARVTLMQRGTEVMPAYDAEVRAVIREMLADSGIEVMTGVTYERVEQIGRETIVHVTVNGVSRSVAGDALLIAAGRDPNTEALALDVAGVTRGLRGEPLVDATLRTANPRIYAAGDVTLGPQFVYVAAYEGKLAAKNALGLSPLPEQVDLSVIPMVTFTHPAIAAVGLTEEAAHRQGLRVKSSTLPLEAVTRALANRDTQGIFKMVAEEDTGRVKGVQIVAENAGDVIYAAQLAVKFRLTIQDLTDTLAPYLTMAEGLKLTALTFDQDVAKLSCCAG